MYYCGIDLSFNSSGLIVINDDLEIIKSKIISSDPSEDIDIRIWDISTEILKHLEPFKSSLQINMEGLSFFILKSQRGIQLAGLHFVVRHNLIRNNFSYMVTPPTKLKKFITGKGNAKKNIMIKEIYKKWGVDFDSDDLADAYGLARMIFELKED